MLLLAASSAAIAGVVDRPFFRANALVIVFGASDFSENGGTAPIVFDFHTLDGATSGDAAPDLISDDGVTINFNANTYNPTSNGIGSGWEFEVSDQTSGGAFMSAGPHQTLDKNDAYTAFGLDNDTDMDLLGAGNRASRFYVASNVAFDIFGQATDLVATGDFSGLDYNNIRYQFRMTRTGGSGTSRWGQNAQNPNPGGSGIVLGGGGGTTLNSLSSGAVKVYDGGRKTASSRGSIMQQAVSFQSRYRLTGSGITGNNYDFSMGAGSLGAEVTYTVYTP
jgi:hypothetical protein